jgi:hypothetical protein
VTAKGRSRLLDLHLPGSIAAGLQATLGNVGAGSSFALAQSIAMGGAAVPLFGVVIGGAVVGGVAYGVASAFK